MSTLFVVPDPSGHPSGGTRYNLELLRELRAHDMASEHCEPEALESALIQQSPRWVVIDSLYLESFDRLVALVRRSGARAALLLHYLPSLVESRGNTTSPLAPDETRAIRLADVCVTTSDWLRGVISAHAVSEARCFAVEPGSACEPLAAPASVRDGLRALVVAHVLPAKGIYALLTGLGRVLRGERWMLSIAGDLDVHAEYARSCQRFAQQDPPLQGRVQFLGCLSQERLNAAYGWHNLVVSASEFEAYGMALADARRVGLPLLARRGGNVEQHVRAAWGGELTSDVHALSTAFARLFHDPAEHQARAILAHRFVPEPRPWSLVATEFQRALAVSELQPKYE